MTQWTLKTVRFDRLLRFGLAIACLIAVPAHGHYMGKTIPLLYEGGERADLASYVIASYIGEQMGAEIQPRPVLKGESVTQLLKIRKAPWVLRIQPTEARPYTGLVKVQPHFAVAGLDAVIYMTEESSKDLKFSLLSQYILKIRSGIDREDWETGLARVRAGEGVRKVALQMLREADLI